MKILKKCGVWFMAALFAIPCLAVAPVGCAPRYDGPHESQNGGYTGPTVHEHTWEPFLSVGAVTHGRMCSGCYIEEWERHTYGEDGRCTVCGQVKTETEGLEYILNEDTNSYTVSGLGSVTENEIVIPSHYLGKPVTEIGMSAFDSSDLHAVEIPDTVTLIREYAISSCHHLIDAVIPSSVSKIESRAFYDSSLEELTLSNGIEEIGAEAFSRCFRLSKLVIPKSLTSFQNAFPNCGLKEIEVDEENPLFFSKDNCVIEAESKTLVLGCETSVIPADGSVTKIGEHAFYGASLESIELPATVTSIAGEAFGNCYLKELNIPDTVTTISRNAFCENTALKKVTIGSGVKLIIGPIFTGCTNLNEVTVKKNANYFSEGDCLIEKGGTLIDAWGSFEIADSVSSIGPYTFYDRKNLTEIEIPESVTSIKEYAFYDCWDLKEVTFANGLTSIGEHAFDSCRELTRITIPESVTEIKEYAFASNWRIEEITLFDGLEKIGEGAFHGCNHLREVTIPSSVTEVGDQAFMYCDMYEIHIPDRRTDPNTLIDIHTTIGKEAFYYGKYTTLTIGKGVRVIGDGAFSSKSLKEVTIPASVIAIGAEAFSSESLERVFFESPYGWSVFRNDINSGKYLTGLEDPELAAQYFKKDYTRWSWRH